MNTDELESLKALANEKRLQRLRWLKGFLKMLIHS